eukprot:scaffold34598_cov76-Amphora_coffeaeformis.AAC.1
MPVRVQVCAPHLYHDIAERLKDVRELGTDLSEKVFCKMNHLLGIEDGFLEGSADRISPITLHRVTPVPEEDQKRLQHKNTLILIYAISCSTTTLTVSRFIKTGFGTELLSLRDKA